ncbi:tyrosine-type recombinase/integrase [Roseovarius sp. C03]|uniref:tyrosine-type recombinase/integrase n=1 Tax=Roseovarius sp. C03 TaxID=3449222 RepID=UPI003EDC8A2F
MLKLWRRNNAGNWIIRGQVEGERIHKSTGTDQRRLAEAQRIRLEAEILERRAYGRAATVTFAEAALTYIESGGETRFLARIIEHFGPDKLLRDVDNDAVNIAARALYPDCAPATIDRQLVTPISAVVTMAAEDGLCQLRKFRKRAKDNKRIRWLTPEEAEDLIAAAREIAPHLLRPLGILLGSGARTGEALRLQRATFHLATGEAFIEETKNGEPRMIRFPRRAIDMICDGDLPEVGPICLTPKGRPYVMRANGGGQIAGAFKNIREAAGLGPEVTPHVLRHTWATWFHAQTRDFGALMDLGGWRKSDMANRYRKIAPEDLADRLFARGWDFTREEFRRDRKTDTARPETGLRVVR